MSSSALFLGNLAYNVVLGGGHLHRVRWSPAWPASRRPARAGGRRRAARVLGVDQSCTLLALVAVAVAGARLRSQHRIPRLRRRRGAPADLSGVQRRSRQEDRLGRRAARLRNRHLRRRLAALRHGGGGRRRHRGDERAPRDRAADLRRRRGHLGVRVERRHPGGDDPARGPVHGAGGNRHDGHWLSRWRSRPRSSTRRRSRRSAPSWSPTPRTRNGRGSIVACCCGEPPWWSRRRC